MSKEPFFCVISSLPARSNECGGNEALKYLGSLIVVRQRRIVIVVNGIVYIKPNQEWATAPDGRSTGPLVSFLCQLKEGTCLSITSNIDATRGRDWKSVLASKRLRKCELQIISKYLYILIIVGNGAMACLQVKQLLV